MIPRLNESGYLPPGVHAATVGEIIARFGWQSEARQAQAESLRWLVELAARAGALRVIVNGSFVTDVLEPNDVDCVLLVDDAFPRDASAEAELLGGLPFLHVQVVEPEGFAVLVERVFANDRQWQPKGMIEVLL